MDATKQLELRKCLIERSLKEEQSTLKYADGLAYKQSQARIKRLGSDLHDVEQKLSVLNDIKALEVDRHKAITDAQNAVKLNMALEMLASCYVSSSDEYGLTAERYSVINNNIKQALGELGE